MKNYKDCKMIDFIKSVEYNEDLKGFIVELKDDRFVQVIFEIENNRLHADYSTHYAVIDKMNNYDLDLSCEEEEFFNEWLLSDRDIQDKAKELGNI